MKRLRKTILVLIAVCAFSTIALADKKLKTDDEQGRETSGSNPAVVVVRSAAKGTWAVTKFSAEHLAKPVARKVLLHAAPATGKFVLKFAAKQALPLVAKVAVL